MKTTTLFSLKTTYFFCFFFLLFLNYSFGQVSVCLGENKIYSVDVFSEPGDTDNGTPGSTYAWSVTGLNANTLVTTGNGSNRFQVDWSNATVGETYTITVTETNTITSCVGEPETLTVTVLNAPSVTINVVSPICSGDDAVFTITGNANATVTFTITGNPTSQTVDIEPDGDVEVIVSGATSNQTLTVTNVEGTSGCTTSVTTSATIQVNPLPQTSTIGSN